MAAQLLGAVTTLQPAWLSLCRSGPATGGCPFPPAALRALFPSRCGPPRSRPDTCLFPQRRSLKALSRKVWMKDAIYKKYILSFRKNIPILSQILCIKKKNKILCLVNGSIRSCSSSCICLLLVLHLSPKNPDVGHRTVLPSAFRAGSTYLRKK